MAGVLARAQKQELTNKIRKNINNVLHGLFVTQGDNSFSIAEDDRNYILKRVYIKSHNKIVHRNLTCNVNRTLCIKVLFFRRGD